MKNLSLFLLLLTLASCDDDFSNPGDDPVSVYEEMWNYIDENFVFFEHKNIVWNEVKKEYDQRIDAQSSEDELFELCKDLLFELKDGHAFLRTRDSLVAFEPSDGFEVFFDLEMVKENYLDGLFNVVDNFTFGVINEDIGYVHYSDFSKGRSFSEVITFMQEQEVKELIIDIRDNGGGDPQIAQSFVGFFTQDQPILGFMFHKNGPGENDYTPGIALRPIPQNQFLDVPVKVLINRNSFSASSYFAGMVSHLDNFTIVGQITGGGGGAAPAYELPNGWVLGVSNNFFLDAFEQHIESGVAPDIEVINAEEDLLMGRDRMLEACF